MPLKKVSVFIDNAPMLYLGVYTPAIITNGFIFTLSILGTNSIIKKIIYNIVIN